MADLVRSGALVRHTDRWLAVEPGMTDAVLRIAAREAIDSLAPS